MDNVNGEVEEWMVRELVTKENMVINDSYWIDTGIKDGINGDYRCLVPRLGWYVRHYWLRSYEEFVNQRQRMTHVANGEEKHWLNATKEDWLSHSLYDTTCPRMSIPFLDSMIEIVYIAMKHSAWKLIQLYPELLSADRTECSLEGDNCDNLDHSREDEDMVASEIVRNMIKGNRLNLLEFNLESDG